MSATRTRRPPARRAPGSALPALAQAALEQEAKASVALDRDQTHALEEPAKEEVVVEPNLPVEQPAPTPAGPPEPEDEPLQDDPDVEAGLERLAAVGVHEEEADDARIAYLRAVGEMSSTEPVFVAGIRAPRLKVGDYTLQPGEIVPGAHGWTRREAYERLGRIERV